jgi:hypothetical protein
MAKKERKKITIKLATWAIYKGFGVYGCKRFAGKEQSLFYGCRQK